MNDGRRLPVSGGVEGNRQNYFAKSINKDQVSDRIWRDETRAGSQEQPVSCAGSQVTGNSRAGGAIILWLWPHRKPAPGTAVLRRRSDRLVVVGSRRIGDSEMEVGIVVGRRPNGMTG
jgi:hypothetical protein